MKAVLIGGTWAIDGVWWRPGSPFAREAERIGVEIAAGRGGGFVWSTKLEIWRPRTLGADAWTGAAHHLLTFIDAYCGGQADVIAHSHGGNVAAIAAHLDRLENALYPPGHRDYPPRIRRLTTVGTPVRWGMSEVYRDARRMTASWRHIYSTADRWQIFGTLGTWNLWKSRKMKFARENVLEPGRRHSELLAPRLWTERGWWPVSSLK